MRPRKWAVSTKRTWWPRRAARSMTCCLFVGSATRQSCGDTQMIEKGFSLTLAHSPIRAPRPAEDFVPRDAGAGYE